MIDQLNNSHINHIRTFYKEYTIICWSSSLIGRNSKHGDIDVYLIGDTKPDLSYRESGLILDIEFVDIYNLSNIIEKLNDHISFLDLTELKMLYKLATGKIISEYKDNYTYLSNKIDLHLLQKSITFYWNSIYVSLMDDISKFINDNNYEATLLQLFALIESAEAIYLCNKGIPCIKRKWIHNDFISNYKNEYDDTFKNLLEKLESFDYKNFSLNVIDLCNTLRFNS